MLGVRKRLTDAARDDFWKVRKAGFSLLMAMVGDAKPIALGNGRKLLRKSHGSNEATGKTHRQQAPR